MSLRSIIDADLADVFFNSSDFNTLAVYDGAYNIYGHFDNEYIEAIPGGAVGVASTNPVFLAKLDDFVPNLLTYSEQFDQWGLFGASSGVVTSDTDVAPDGTTTADTLTDDFFTVEGVVSPISVPVVDGEILTVSLHTKDDLVDRFTRFPALRVNFTGGSTGWADARFETQFHNMATTTTNGCAVISKGFDSASGWSRWWLTCKNNNAGNNLADVIIMPAIGSGDDMTVIDSSVTGSIVAWGAQLSRGSTLMDYKKIEGLSGIDNVIGDSLVVEGVNYTIVGAEPDGIGAVRLILKGQ